MKQKTLVALGAAVLALALVGAKEAFRAPVELGGAYTISNGAAAVQGTVTADLGNGWFLVKRKDGRETKVNVANAFFVEDLK